MISATTTTLFMNYSGLDLDSVVAMATTTIASMIGSYTHFFITYTPYIVGYFVVVGVLYIASYGMKKII